MAIGRAGGCAAYFLADLMATKTAADAEPRRDTPDSGKTKASRHGHSEPRLPHERDESSDEQTGIPDARVQQAARDVAQGQQDTGRSPVVTELARKEFPSRSDRPTGKTAGNKTKP